MVYWYTIVNYPLLIEISGGGIFSTGVVDLENSEITSNTAPNGGGIYFEFTSSSYGGLGCSSGYINNNTASQVILSFSY